MCVPKFSVPNLDENQKYQNHPTLYALFSIAIYQIIVVFLNQLKYYSYILYHKKKTNELVFNSLYFFYNSLCIVTTLFVKGHNHDFIRKCSFFHFFKYIQCFVNVFMIVSHISSHRIMS